MGNEKEGKFAKILGAVGDSIEALVGSMPKEKQDEYKLKILQRRDRRVYRACW